MERDLVERAMAGDHDAFTELARVSIGRLYVIARLILRDDAKAEDATQEALVAAWRHISRLRDPDRFEAWLHRLLVNACYREAGADRRRRDDRGRRRDRWRSPDADSSLDLADRDQLERGFRRLDTDQRAVLVLHYYLGLASTRRPRSSASRRARSVPGCIGRPGRCAPRSRPTRARLADRRRPA